jgi:hypothetical protein
MDKVRKPNISVCYTPSSEPYTRSIYTKEHVYDTICLRWIYTFVAYLMTLSAPQTAHRQMTGEHELQGTSEGAIVAQMRALSWYSPGRTEDNQENPQSEQLLSRPGLEQGT